MAVLTSIFFLASGSIDDKTFPMLPTRRKLHPRSTVESWATRLNGSNKGQRNHGGWNSPISSSGCGNVVVFDWQEIRIARSTSLSSNVTSTRRIMKNCYKIPVAVARHICSHLGSFQCQCQGIVSRLAMPDALVETRWTSMTLTSMCFLIGWYFCIIDLYLSYSCKETNVNTSGINKVHHGPIHSKQGKIVQTVSAKLEDVKPKACEKTRDGGGQMLFPLAKLMA